MIPDYNTTLLKSNILICNQLNGAKFKHILILFSFPVTRPDGQSEALGLTVLDEPTARQSDPSVLELQLRAISKQSSQKAAQVKKIDSGKDLKSQAILIWPIVSCVGTTRGQGAIRVVVVVVVIVVVELGYGVDG